MGEVTDDLVTRGTEAGDLHARIAAVTRRMIANPDNIGPRLRLGLLLEEAGQREEARRVLGEAVARFPNNTVARARLDTLQTRPAPSPASEPALMAEPEFAQRTGSVAEDAPPSPVSPRSDVPVSPPAQERRFAAQEALLDLARAAQGASGDRPAVHPEPAIDPSATARPIGLQAEPALRLRLNPLHPRYRAEIYFAACLIAAVAASGVVALRASHSGLLIDRDVPTPIMLAPRPAPATPPAPSPEPAPQTVVLPPATVPRAVSTVPDTLAAQTPALSVEVPPAMVESAPWPPAPARTALPVVTLDYPAHDARAARSAADLAARLQRAGIGARQAPRAGAGGRAGITFFFAEDAESARIVAATLDGMGQARQAPIPQGGEVLPGTIRISLPGASAPRRPG